MAAPVVAGHLAALRRRAIVGWRTSTVTGGGTTDGGMSQRGRRHANDECVHARAMSSSGSSTLPSPGED